ncbi:hypothetical protein ACYSNX_11435 [Myroides sp. LJL115]
MDKSKIALEELVILLAQIAGGILLIIAIYFVAKLILKKYG